MDITDAAGRLADPVADSPERAELRLALRSLIEREAPPGRIRQLDEAEEFDDHLYAKLNDLGVLGIDAPESLGGAGDVRDQLVVIEELAAGPTSMAAFMIVQYMIIQVLGAFASTDEQRGVLADLVAARTKVSFSLSEPDGGTDVARVMKTRAEGDASRGWRLNGHKMWTSGATRAQWLIVLARTGEPTRSAIDGVSMLLVPTDAKGVEIRPIDTLGIHGLSTCEVFFDDVALAGDALIGEENAGFRQAFRTLNREGIIACAASLGVGCGALEYLTAYTRDRQVFGKAIGSFQVPQHWMVDAAVHLEAARSLMVRAAEVEVAGGRADMLALMAKLMASEAAQDITLKGMQLMGGFGYSRELPMQRWFRDVRLWSFAPLNNEMVRNRIGERLLGLPPVVLNSERKMVSKDEFTFSHRLRVRWAEVDRQGIVFNGHYLTYFDVGMTEYLRTIGIPYPDGLLEYHGDLFLVKATVEFKSPALYDDELDCHVRIGRIGSSSMQFLFALYRGDDLLVTGENIYVNAHPVTRTPAPVHQAVRDAVSRFEQA